MKEIWDEAIMKYTLMNYRIVLVVLTKRDINQDSYSPQHGLELVISRRQM